MTEPVIQPAGKILDDLGVQLALRPGDVPVSAIVIVDIARADGSEDDDGDRILVGHSEPMRWPTELGLLEAAIFIAKFGIGEDDE